MLAIPNTSSQSDRQPYLQIRHLSKTFGAFVALSDISLGVYPGELICFLGPSGCGKTTLLRIIAGLEEQNTGQIIQGDVDVSSLPASQRDFGIVFQSYALFPNLTSARNIAYGLENNKLPKTEINTRVRELLELVGLAEFGNKFPAQLSGGQQQRVALARALALSPGLLLLDEPLSALDARVRASLRSEVSQLQKRLGVTTIMVTHDQEEALTMADRIVVMDQGRIAQVGTPLEIYRKPATPFVADFVGVMNFLPGMVTQQSNQVQCGAYLLLVSNGDSSAQAGDEVMLAIRPEDVQLIGVDLNAPDTLKTQLIRREFLGSFYRLTLAIEDNPEMTLLADVSSNSIRHLDRAEGDRLPIQLQPDSIRVFATARPGQDLS